MAEKTKKIPVRVNSWLARCDEQFVYDSDVGSEVRFYDMFKMPEFGEFERETDHVVEGRQRLDQLAKRYYDDEYLWWVIAARNGLDLPDEVLYEGMKLKIPNSDYVKNRLLRG